jgi:hypothetical protein
MSVARVAGASLPSGRWQARCDQHRAVNAPDHPLCALVQQHLAERRVLRRVEHQQLDLDVRRVFDRIRLGPR